jgi:hypothetical protein
MPNEEKIVTAKAIVAHGRSIMVPHPTRKRVIRSHPMTGEPQYSPETVTHLPGEELNPPAQDRRCGIPDRGFGNSRHIGAIRHRANRMRKGRFFRKIGNKPD